MKYPRVGEIKRKPNLKLDGVQEIGLPCIVCSINTIGTRWIEVDYMRGNDVLIRGCCSHIKDKAALIAAFVDGFEFQRGERE